MIVMIMIDHSDVVELHNLKIIGVVSSIYSYHYYYAELYYLSQFSERSEFTSFTQASNHGPSKDVDSDQAL